MAQEKPPANREQPDFEAALKELEAVVAALEQGDVSLDAALAHFERGVKLTRICQQALRAAEQKVEILLKEDGVERVESFTPED